MTQVCMSDCIKINCSQITSVLSHGLSCSRVGQSVSLLTVANLHLAAAVPTKQWLSRFLPVASLIAFADMLNY